ncbi:hypothetical protein CYMTET_26507 [Cymbomonas tetramitiformis]|uniref:Uncharacterized protein n=1 Tax=Cymbomonas tetramitiformis TaxID=36881 RepID=A0AAE0FRL0_9CHLO|nr:hypothetical protein CYMTET_26507 [Cymbomonas tetramitiformis]
MYVWFAFTRSVQYKLLVDTLRNYQVDKTTNWRWQRAVKNMCYAASLQRSGGAALNILRGACGAETGTTITKDAVKFANINLPSEQGLHAFGQNEGIDPAWREGVSVPMIACFLERVAKIDDDQEASDADSYEEEDVVIEGHATEIAASLSGSDDENVALHKHRGERVDWENEDAFEGISGAGDDDIGEGVGL